MGPHTKNGPVLLQNVAPTPWNPHGCPWFSGPHIKNRTCFAAERGPDPFGHTRALEGPFFDSSPGTRFRPEREAHLKPRNQAGFCHVKFCHKIKHLEHILGRSRGDPFARCGPH